MSWLGRRGGLEAGVGVAIASVAVTAMVLADASSGRSQGRPASPPEHPPADASPAARWARALDGFDPAGPHAAGPDGALRSPLPGGREAVLSLDPTLQAHLEAELARFEVPFGAVVAVEPASGRVRAWASHSTANPGAGDLARDPSPPAASVFKIVTAAALVDTADVGPDSRVCWRGGVRGLETWHLSDDAARGGECNTLAEAMGGSINVIFARLADRHLDTPTLRRYASAFGFGHALPFDAPTRGSAVAIPDRAVARLEFARTAAGFWHTHLSPFHGALLAATIANDGRMPRATMVDQVRGADGAVLLDRRPPEVVRPVIPRRTARLVAQMMEHTCRRHGTAGGAFFDPRGRPFLPGVRVAGKTGSLSTERPYRGYSWWVGFAPADAPRLAVAALVVNRPRWRIKASYLARETLRVGLRAPPATEP